MLKTLPVFIAILSLAVGLPAAAQEIDTTKLIAEQRATAPKISTEELKRMIDEKQDFVLLDVRTQNEIAFMGRIDTPAEIAIPRGWVEIKFPNQVKDLNKPIVAYCGTGVRSAFATNTLRALGYTNVRNYDDGIIGWQKAGLPVADD